MKMLTSIILVGSLFCLFVGCTDNGNLKERVIEYRLDNGMKWLIVRRGYAPVFAGVLQVKSGSVDEVSGKTGIAHLLEHMAFKGTSSIGTTDFESEKLIMKDVDALVERGGADDRIKELIAEQKTYIVAGELWDIFSRNGATNLNAYTSKDLTTYHSEMSTSKLELWMFLISEMFYDPVYREFYSERDVVLEELRSSIDNSPRGTLYKRLLETAYRKGPYTWPTIGVKEDVSKLTRGDLKEFYESRYSPECMVGAIVGDVDLQRTKELLQKYFGRFKQKSKNCDRTLVLSSPAGEEKRTDVEFDAEPMLLMAYHKPTLPSFDDYVFDVISYMLCEGGSSRLEKRLVKQERLAKQVYCFGSYPGVRLPNLFIVYAEPLSTDLFFKLEKVVEEELVKLATETPSEKELEKVKRQLETGFLMGIDSNFSLARQLVYFENVAGSWQYITSHSKNVERIKASDITDVAHRYFLPENKTVVRLKRGKQ